MVAEKTAKNDRGLLFLLPPVEGSNGYAFSVFRVSVAVFDLLSLLVYLFMHSSFHSSQYSSCSLHCVVVSFRAVKLMR